MLNELDGVFQPEYKDSLLKLKGVGDYTASAIASICYDAIKQLLLMVMCIRVLSHVILELIFLLIRSKGLNILKNLAQRCLPKTMTLVITIKLSWILVRDSVNQRTQIVTCLSFKQKCACLEL